MYTIGTIAKLTGLTPETIRAWERRYGAVRPERTGGGHRLYAEGDLERLTLLNRVCETGRPIGVIASLDNSELIALLENTSPGEARSSQDSVARVVDAVARFDSVACERELRIALATLPFRDAAERVIIPALVNVGDLWERGELTISHERLLSSIAHRLLLGVLSATGAGRRTRIVLGTLPGEEHAIGCLVAAVLAAQAGFHTYYVGTGLPAEEIARTAASVNAAAAVVCFVRERDDQAVATALSVLDLHLPKRTQLWLGGKAAPTFDRTNSTAVTTKVSNFDDFLRRLEVLDASRSTARQASQSDA